MTEAGAGDHDGASGDHADSSAERLGIERGDVLRRLAGRLARVGGWAVDGSDGSVYWSDELHEMLESPIDQGVPPIEATIARYPGAHREKISAALDRCLSEGVPFDLELEVETYGGRRIPARIMGEADRDSNGEVRGAVGAFQDISDLRMATQEAQDAARRLGATLESMTDAVYMLDRDWRFTYVNSNAAQLLRREARELIGRGIWEEFPGAVDSAIYDVYAASMADRHTRHLDEFYFAPLGAWFQVDVYPADQGLAVYFRDITDARTARLELEEREAALQRQADLLDQAQDAIIVRDPEGRITYWNRSAERIYGWFAEEAIGADVRSLLYEDRMAFDVAHETVLRAGRWVGELRHRTRRGDVVEVAARWTLVRGQGGAPEAIMAINTDITDRKRVEQQLLRAQRMESIGTLAGGVAHDLNNVLAPILLAGELLQSDSATIDRSSLVETIVTSARRGADLVSQVLSFARGVEGERRPVDVGALVADIGAIVRDTFPKNIALSLEVPATLTPIVGDSTQIQQVLLNLVVNARDAMPSGGHLRLAASQVLIDDQYAATTPGSKPGTYLLVEVEDDGEGMAPDVRDRAFEPFFTTKAHGVGTGLGLSTAVAIIESHGGFLHVYSELDRGTRFRVYLPCDLDVQEPQAPASTAADPPRGSGQTVLVVEDEAAIRAMTRQTLETYGYRVLEAANGAEAVAVFAREVDGVHAVLTDMMMPVMDGPATILALQALDPEVRFIGASGLHGNGKVAQAAAAGVEHFLPKPYETRRLLEVLAAVLGGDPSEG
ncbi:PAS domain S-box protein [Acidimicrobiia bacterium EGI L10123]|uniref:PAS domain-containing hybrid sensor histidine kinase/response regulator n=1 Tax=Salinilacustrithrix flava TaxID=2957203 RepID=UPI003D7C35C9|nr:PAS domain S-box protein [Acidimicrobiia bacterium EGI L10123]